MKSPEYTQLAPMLEELSASQIQKLQNHVAKHTKHKATALLLAKLPVNDCPHCQSNNFNCVGFRNDLQRYKCKSCNRTFNQLTGTPLARLRKKGRWLDFAAAMTEGKSVRAAAKDCSVDKNTSFRWRHRFLQWLQAIESEQLTGIVEVKEIHFPYSEKGARELDRKPRKRGQNIEKHTQTVCVIAAQDRHQHTFDKIIPSLNCQSLKTLEESKVARDALVCSENKMAYIEYTTQQQLRHGRLDLSSGEKVVKDIVHLRNISNYLTRLQDWMGRFRGVATKYLHAYLGWFRNLNEFNMKMPNSVFLLRAKSGIAHTHIPLTNT